MPVSKQKDIRKSIIQQLEQSLDTLKALLGDKKFSRRVKKAAKLLTEGIDKSLEPAIKKVTAPAVNKLPVKKKTATKKTTATAATPAAPVAPKAPATPKAAKATKAPAPKKQAAAKQAKAK